MPKHWLKLAALLLIGLIGASLAQAAPAVGSISIKRLHPALGEKELVYSYRLSPDQATVIYKAGDFSLGSHGLLAVPRRGDGAPLPISRPEDTGRITQYAVTPDSQSLIYNIGSALISVSLDGTDAQTLTLPLSKTDTFAESIGEFWIAPDQQSLVYTIGTYPHTHMKVMRSNLDGSAPVQLAISPALLFVEGLTGQRVVYRTGQDQESPLRLFSVPLQGGQAVAMTAGLAADQYVDYKVEISPDGQTAVFPVRSTTTGARLLYAAPLTGPGLVQLSDPAHLAVLYALISPDSQSVIYAREWGDQAELFRVARGGGAVAKLSGTVKVEKFYQPNRLEFTPDSQRIVFVGLSGTGITPNYRLFSVPLSGGDPLALSDAAPVQLLFVIAQSGQTVVYGHWSETTRNTLHKVPLGGGAPTPLSGFLGDASNLQMLQAPDGGNTVIAVNAGPSVHAAYAFDLRTGTAKLLNPAPFGTLYVDRENAYTVTRSGDIIFVARDINSPSQDELFVTIRDDQPVSVFLPLVRR
ncbi:MAG TPA: hypothetical protein VD886_26600 [Herpetosiphonaceae bacterium]|nr:hypothetical protein [Herpetosiphonaceae bacterium]